MIRRVVAIGMGGVTAFGENWQDASARLLAYENAMYKVPEWQACDGLHTLLGAPVGDFTLPEHYTRKHIRATGRMSQMSTRASELTLEQAGLIGDLILTNGGMGTAYGSSTGSTGSVSEFATMLTEKHIDNITSTTYAQAMLHTIAVNTGLFFGLRGRVIPTSSACTSDSQVISYAWETICHGYQTVMVAGGVEESCSLEVAVFNTLSTISQRNDAPKTTPSPFDENRDELVIGEGAGIFVFGELEHTRARGMTIYSEIADFAANCDAAHIIRPQRETMQYCVEQSLKIAGLSAQDIGYTPTHGTATDRDDMVESLAMVTIYGDNALLSSLKSCSGHTLDTCGMFEAWMSLQMMHEGWFAPTLDLNKPNLNCGALDCIVHEARKVDYEFLQGSNFAFGDINTSIIIKRRP